MPFVKSYFRRSPGAADLGESAGRRLDVAIYAADGASLLREAAGGRWRIDDLQFESGLPGGFLSASFRLAGAAARDWPGRSGLVTVIRRGNRVLWWGWIEDLARASRGRVTEIGVKCLGPWQQPKERLCDVDYTGTVAGDQAIIDHLQRYCPDISRNYDGIAATGTNIAPLAWTNKPVADLIKLVCQSGNAAGQMLLFAVWEPTWSAAWQYPATGVSNPTLEAGSILGPTAWSYHAVAGSAGSWDTLYARSPIHSLRAVRTAGTGTQTGYWEQLDVPAPGSTSYIVDYAVRMGLSGGGLTGQVELRWRTSGSVYISSTNLAAPTGTTSWQRRVVRVTPPANAAYVDIRLHAALPDAAGAAINWDDIFFYAEGAAWGIDRLPQGRLWARDLSGWEYRLYTRELDADLQTDESTAKLANCVVASYGSGSFTSTSADMSSQLRYRRRDVVVAAGESASQGVAERMRDAHLALHRAPEVEANGIKLSRPGAVRTARGLAIWPEDLRAGDRLLIADGALAGQVILLTRVSYANGVVTATPERPADVPLLLARR